MGGAFVCLNVCMCGSGPWNWTVELIFAAVRACVCFSSSVMELQKGIKGLVVMSSSLEETFNCIFDGQVPPLWEKVTHHYANSHALVLVE